MARTLYEAPVPPLNTLAGTALANSITLTDISPAPQVILPANQLDAGVILRCTAFGVFSTTLTPTLLLGFYYGAVAGVALATTGAVTTGSGVTNVPWRLVWEGRVRTTGTAGTIMGQGYCDFGTSVSAVTHLPIPNTALATVTIDTTTAKAITVGAQWGTASASNTVTCHHHTVELIG